MKELLTLFRIFFRMGAFTFGGGYAMLPIIQDEIVEKRKWATQEEVMDYYAIGQVTPGIIAINTATFIGYKRKGLLGALSATLGMVTPSVIIIGVIAAFLNNFAKEPIVQHALGGIRIVVVALILETVWGMLKKSVKDKTGWVIFGIGFLLIAFLPISPVWIILAAAFLGITLKRKERAK
jgi:chromate transporter